MNTQFISKLADGHLPALAYLIPLCETGTTPIEIGEFMNLGRDQHCELEIADPFVSSKHARIEKRSNGYKLRDMGSRNGTWVNENRIVELFLNDGDHLRLGQREFLFSFTNLTQVQDNLSSKNPEWSQTLKSLPSVARTLLPALLTGESGTGKEVVANKLHELSDRSNKPFISINCSALSESLTESELFGHIKGSFTGATENRKGAFEAARGGTLFLDEIGDLPLNLQPKLLRALENKEIRPVGSDHSIKTDVRIIAATHKDLNKQVQSGEFRSDLYYRLHVIQIKIPALRNRREDFEEILYSFAREMKVRFSNQAVIELQSHNWPGNIRELKNMVARASALFNKIQIMPEHLSMILDRHEPNKIISSGSHLPVLKEVEKNIIVQRLIANQGNQRKTAIELGMPKSTLHDRIRTYNIDIKNLVGE